MKSDFKFTIRSESVDVEVYVNCQREIYGSGKSTEHRRVVFNCRDSKLMIALGVLFIIFLCLSIAVIVAWAIISDGFKNLGGSPDVCTSATCVSAGLSV